MKSEISTGKCLCGEIQFEIKNDPLWIGHCHCQSCRRNTGSALATFVGVRNIDIQFTKGERQFYESSPGVQRGFCRQCGTPLTYEATRFPNEVHIYISTLDEPQHFQPEFHVYYSERISWFEVTDDLPRYSQTLHSVQE